MQAEISSSGGHAARTYVLTYIALMVLLALTCSAAYLPLGAFNLVIALGIALAKAALVVLFFMHMRTSSGLVRLVSAAGLLWLLILFGLMLSDYLSRGWVPLVR